MFKRLAFMSRVFCRVCCCLLFLTGFLNETLLPRAEAAETMHKLALPKTLSKASSVPQSGIIVVVHSAVKINELDTQDLRQIYLGKMVKWNDGQRVRVAQLKVGELPERFSREFIDKPFIKYKLYWNRVVASGTGVPPRAFKSEAELIKYVKKTEGAIGYVSGAINTDGVKVVTVKVQ